MADLKNKLDKIKSTIKETESDIKEDIAVTKEWYKLQDPKTQLIIAFIAGCIFGGIIDWFL